MKMRKTLSTLACLAVVMPLLNWSSNDASFAPDIAVNPNRSEFARIIEDFSESDPGTYSAPNLVSNEPSYLHPFPGVLKLGSGHGAYIGVAPEQNFTYIAKFRPKVAFIVDIQRKNWLQHLMYKAIFADAETPTEFLQILFARKHGTIEELLSAESDNFDRVYANHNLRRILEAISGYGVTLTPDDRRKLTWIYSEFNRLGGSIICTTPPMRPTLRQLVYERDARGHYGNFLLSQDDYAFVRDMQHKDLIIPIVGNVGGTKALPAVAKWLKKHRIPVSVYYISSVEYHICGEKDVWTRWLRNVRSLPWEKNAIIIRAVPYANNSETRSGYDWTTLVQWADEYPGAFGKQANYYKMTGNFIPLRIDR